MAAPIVADTVRPEQHFLDLTIEEVLTNAVGFPKIEEPWGSMYVDALREGRFGDAVWARYHMMVETVDDVIIGDEVNPSVTVLESIKEDAAGYSSDAELYAEAVAFYSNTSEADGHKDIVDLIISYGKGIEVEKGKL
ncbi:hypothetical protein ACHAQA_005134 [Verticillium albo-atrum]